MVWLGSAKRVAGSQDVINRALRGGYPEAVLRNTEQRRTDWFEAYVTTLLQRDVRDLVQIQGLSELPLLLALLAARATATLNASDLARAAQMPLTTLNRYLTLLEATFLLHLVPAWSSNLSSRLVRAPKILLSDTGVLAALTGMSQSQLEMTPTAAGMLIENFVGMELVKLISWSQLRPHLFHFRTHDRKEVDFLLQSRAGGVVGIEVKAASAVYKRVTSKDYAPWPWRLTSSLSAALCFTQVTPCSPLVNNWMPSPWLHYGIRCNRRT